MTAMPLFAAALCRGVSPNVRSLAFGSAPASINVQEPRRDSCHFGPIGEGASFPPGLARSDRRRHSSSALNTPGSSLTEAA